MTRTFANSGSLNLHSEFGLSLRVLLARNPKTGAADGLLAFAAEGEVLTRGGATDDVANSVSFQSDGKILVAGYGQGSGGYDFAIVRFNANGSLDKAGLAYDEHVRTDVNERPTDILVAGGSVSAAETA